MFKVYANNQRVITTKQVFQNISCLRFMPLMNILTRYYKKFQNISCLRFIAIFSSFMNL